MSRNKNKKKVNKKKYTNERESESTRVFKNNTKKTAAQNKGKNKRQKVCKYARGKIESKNESKMTLTDQKNPEFSLCRIECFFVFFCFWFLFRFSLVVVRCVV
jgi:hypothetical protein